jgi:dodecin
MEGVHAFAPQHAGSHSGFRHAGHREEHAMSIARTTEIIASGSSVEDAINNGVARATKTLKNVEEVWVQGVKARVDGNSITEYRVSMKVTFVLEDS